MAVPRRTFLDYLVGGGVAAWLLSAAYPILRYLTPLKQSGSTGPVVLTRQENGTLETQGFVIVPVGTARVIVFADQSGKLHGLAAKCTHEGCTVRYMQREAIVWCACHNGHFDLNGRVISGPPPRPLSTYAVRRDADGKTTVSPEVAS